MYLIQKSFKILLALLTLDMVLVRLPVAQVEVNMQQTPKPAAQFPSEVPPLSSHSSDVMQVPLMVLSDSVTQASCCGIRFCVRMRHLTLLHL